MSVRYPRGAPFSRLEKTFEPPTGAVGYYYSANYDPTAILRQELNVADFASKHGYVVKKGFTEAEKGRPGLAAAIDFVVSHDLRTLIVEDFSRLSRDLSTLLDLHDRTRKLGVTVMDVQGHAMFSAVRRRRGKPRER